MHSGAQQNPRSFSFVHFIIKTLKITVFSALMSFLGHMTGVKKMYIWGIERAYVIHQHEKVSKNIRPSNIEIQIVNSEVRPHFWVKWWRVKKSGMERLCRIMSSIILWSFKIVGPVERTQTNQILTDGRTEEWMNEWMDGLTDGRTNGRTRPIP